MSNSEKVVYVVTASFYDDVDNLNFQMPVSAHLDEEGAQEAAKLYVDAKVDKVNLYEL